MLMLFDESTRPYFSLVLAFCHTDKQTHAHARPRLRIHSFSRFHSFGYGLTENKHVAAKCIENQTRRALLINYRPDGGFLTRQAFVIATQSVKR